MAVGSGRRCRSSAIGRCRCRNTSARGSPRRSCQRRAERARLVRPRRSPCWWCCERRSPRRGCSGRCRSCRQREAYPRRQEPPRAQGCSRRPGSRPRRLPGQPMDSCCPKVTVLEAQAPEAAEQTSCQSPWSSRLMSTVSAKRSPVAGWTASAPRKIGQAAEPTP